MVQIKSDALDQPHVFGALPTPAPRYHGITQSSLYLTMRDGVRLAVELFLPADRGEADRLPALLLQTRYWRETSLRAPFRWFTSYQAMVPKATSSRRFFTAQGYAVVIVDVRGTGASFGCYTRPWSEESFEDAREVVGWIIRQPWSNGRVGAFGVSYPGTTAEYLALLNHPAVKVVIPKFNHPDAYQDISHPGGIFNERFIKKWSEFDELLDSNTLPPEFGISRIFLEGVKPVDADRDRSLLRQALKEHIANSRVYTTVCKITFRDEALPGAPFNADSLSIHTNQTLVESTSTQIVGWASWMDAGTADAALRRFLTFENAGLAVIGAWDHGANHHASPFVSPGTPVDPSIPQQFTEMLHIFDHYLKSDTPAPMVGRLLYYYTLGEEKWKSTPCWPPAGARMERWYFDRESRLSPIASDTAGSDEYRVDFHASTGDTNVWWELGVLTKDTVRYPNRAEADRRLLCYTSEPVEEDLEISGYPIVSLWISSSETDGNFLVYLEEVAPNGWVTYLTEGHLRAIHRRISRETPPYAIQVPYHTYRQADALPLVPGEMAELKFGLNPTSVRVRRGRRLRLAIAGHDEGTFRRVPDTGNPVIRVYRGAGHASAIELPVIRRQV